MAKEAVNLLCNRRMVSSPDNPFSADGRKPRRPLVTDRKMRDALLRKEFDTPSVPSDLDAIVISTLHPPLKNQYLAAAVILQRNYRSRFVLILILARSSPYSSPSNLDSPHR